MIYNKTYGVSPVSKSQNGPPISEYFQTFLDMNPAWGYLTFEVYQDSPVRGRTPIPDAKITVSKLLGDDYYFARVLTTDESGETEPLALPTVSRDFSLQPREGMVYENYHVSVEAPGFIRKDIYDVAIFDGITSVQRVQMQPDREAGTAKSAVETSLLRKSAAAGSRKSTAGSGRQSASANSSQNTAAGKLTSRINPHIERER